MQCDVFVPMKDPARGKSRLSGTLPHEGRRALVLAMLERVIRALQGARQVSHVTIVGGGEVIRRNAERLGSSWLPELGLSLNDTLQRALSRSSPGTELVGIVMGDLPLLSSSDINGALDLFRCGGYHAVIAPDRHQVGTNAVFVRAGHPFMPQFGAESFRRHLGELSRRGYAVAIWRSLGLAWDLDYPEDLVALLKAPGHV